MRTETEQTESLLIAVFGGTGGLGKQLVRLALEQGHSIRALVRNANKLEPQSHPRLEAVVGDATKADDVAAVVTGAANSNRPGASSFPASVVAVRRGW